MPRHDDNSTTPTRSTVDVHQHLWPQSFLDALRARRQPPLLRGWTLRLADRSECEVDPAAHDPGARALLAGDDRIDEVLVAASAGLGLAHLPAREASQLADAWHAGALDLPAPFRPWATAGLVEPDPDGLADALARGCVGLEIPATAFATPADVERHGALLSVLQDADRPLLVHPALPTDRDGAGPSWWVPVVAYVQQMHAAWWSWWQAGRAAFSTLRVCFCALAGLAPLHAERHRARGGKDRGVDPNVFLDTSSYGTQAIDATVRRLGVDVVCHGSDRPYAEAGDPGLGAPVTNALRVVNPRRLLGGPSCA